METTEDVEKRFERAMERLFPGSPPTPSASAGLKQQEERGWCSSEGVSSPVKGRNEKQQQQAAGWQSLPHITRTLATPGLAPPPACRPWDRGDLLRRLATYKSMSWFGKPQVAGPVACASRGWVIVDVDLIGCEICGSRLSLPVPPSWSRHQVESAAQVFAEQLDTAHKGLCAWKNNSCADGLAQFPPMPLPAVLGAYAERCDSLLQLSALPVVSESAINQMLTRGAQVDRLLSKPTVSVPGLLIEHDPGSNTSGDELLSRNHKAFYQAQHAIAICGWEPRLLPYTVDCEDRSPVQSAKYNGHTVTKNPWTAQDPGPIIMIHNQGETQQDSRQSRMKHLCTAGSNPASAVLDCSLCGASVGLWNFATVPRPSPLVVPGRAEMPGAGQKTTDTGMMGVSAASCMDGWGQTRPEPEIAEEPHAEAAEAVTVTVPQKPTPQKGVLDLSLTIAGGPPPTQLTGTSLVPPTVGTVSSKQPHQRQAETSETGEWVAPSYESHGPGHWELGTGHVGSTLDTVQHGKPLVADSVDGTLVDQQEADNNEGKDAEHSSKRKRSIVTVETEEAEVSDYLHSGKRKYKEASLHGPSFFLAESSKELPHTSSVNATDTCYQQKQENSMESVENLPQESDGQGTTIEEQEDGPETVVQAEYSRSHQDAIDPGLSKRDEGGGEQGAETNVAIISTGTATEGGASVGMGGGGSVGMGMSHEAEIRGNVNGAEHTESVACDEEFTMDLLGLMDEFIPGHDSMGEFVPEITQKTGIKDLPGDSQEVVLGMDHVFKKDNGSAGESEASREGTGSQRDNDEHTEGEETLDTTNAVVQGGELDVNVLDKEVTDGHMVQGMFEAKNGEVQSPAHNMGGDVSQYNINSEQNFGAPRLESNNVVEVNCQNRGWDVIWEIRPGFQLEGRNWEIEMREFDPIQQHRHFCPWVNGHVATAGSSSGASALCGWQLTLDALQHQHPPAAGLAESESTASMYKVDPLTSVRKLLGRRSPPKQGLSSRIQS